MQNDSSLPLTFLRLRFHCQAVTQLNLGGLRAGSNLRGALLNVMRRATCDQPAYPGAAPDPDHTARCPVCWLAAADEHPGHERRGYALTPPECPAGSLPPGSCFDFHLMLFGEAARYLPYFVLAVPEAGRWGVGPGRGQFRLLSIFAEHPSGPDWTVLAEGDNLVCPPPAPVTHADLLARAETLASRLNGREPRMRFDFKTPLRLIVDKHLLKSPDFGALFNHILLRVDHLAAQHAGAEPRPAEDRERLWNLANRVRLVKSETGWADVSSGSRRTGQPTWISGMVGPAWYSAPADVWRELLPWLLWGQFVQAGKDTAKGNGVFTFSIDPPGVGAS